MFTDAFGGAGGLGRGERGADRGGGLTGRRSGGVGVGRGGGNRLDRDPNYLDTSKSFNEY